MRSFNSQRGFALAAVLWLLAGLTILSAMISQSSQISAERQMRLRQRADAEQNFLSTRSEALFWLSTSAITEVGFGWQDQLLRPDGRGYAGVANTSIHLQDMRGLINLNQSNRQQLGRFLTHCGASADKLDSLIDALEDYIDTDNLKRLNGAEAMDYSAAGMLPPRNARLVSEPEIWQIFGWASLRKEWDEKHCFEDVTIRGDGRFNLNTATPGALAAFGLTAEESSAALDERNGTNTAIVDAINVRAGASSIFGVASGRYSARTLRTTQTQPDTPWVLRYDLKLTADVEGTPWEISSPRRFPANSVIRLPGRANWPQIDKLSDSEKNAIATPKLPF